MRFVIRAILTGLFIGALFYFVPVGFPILIFLLFLLFFFRFFGGRRWRRGGYGGCGNYSREEGSPPENTPIDGYGSYRAGGPDTAIRRINIQ
ncbi:MAG TPA: hypothetical protein VGM24_10425 [Puia sp.]